jgi:hypothetical protein
MNECSLPVGHVGLAPEDEEHVEAAGPGAHCPPVLLHPGLHLCVLEILRHNAQSKVLCVLEILRQNAHS